MSLQVTIVPRGNGALGFAQYLPKDVQLRTEAQINDMISMALAGRAAEEVAFGKVWCDKESVALAGLNMANR